MKLHNQIKGFTLIEAIMVIVITGILSVIVALFMKQPVDAYIDSGRRAALTDEADTALRRISRDIHKALPNSIRQADNQCIEFIPTKVGGRYRAAVDNAGGGDILDFSATDSSFDMFGLNGDLPSTQQIVADDLIAIYNLGTVGSNAYEGDNTALVSSVTDNKHEATGTIYEDTITINATKPFPFASSNNRFHVIPGDEKIVSYVCNLTDHKLYRNSNYDNGDQCNVVGLTGTQSLLAQHVNNCSFIYSTDKQKQRDALVQITIQLRDESAQDETITLYHEAHINNSP